MKLILLILTSTTCIAITELLKRKFSLSTSVTRRVVHIGTALVAAASPLFVTQQEIVVVSMLFALALLAGRRYNIFSAIHNVSRTSFGDIFLPLSVACVALLFLPHNIAAFQFGICVMGVSDAVAGLIGEKFGKHRIQFFGHTKSVEGSLAFFLCTILIAWMFIPVFGYNIFFVSLLLTTLECCLVFGLDNLLLPLVAAFLFQSLL